MRERVVLMALGLLACGAADVYAQKGKPAPGPTSVNWRCDVVLRDAEGDAIRSDEARTGLLQNAYEDGIDAFTCAMSPPESAASGNPAPGSATFYFGRKPTRAFFIPPRTGAWVGGYDTGLQIRVFSLVDMPIGASTRAMAVPTSLIGSMYADARSSSDTVTDLVSVERTDDCTWVVTFDAPAQIERYTSQDRRQLVDTPQLPLGFTLTTRAPAGSDVGCPSVP